MVSGTIASFFRLIDQKRLEEGFPNLAPPLEEGVWRYVTDVIAVRCG